MMNYKKEGQGINGEISKDGQQQTSGTHQRALYSCQSMHMVRPHRQTWSQNFHCFTYNMINLLPMKLPLQQSISPNNIMSPVNAIPVILRPLEDLYI